MRILNWSSLLPATVVLALSAGSRTLAGQEAEPEPSRLSAAVSMSVASRYVFRGYDQDGPGLFLQPDLRIGYSLYEAASGAIRGARLEAFSWESAHAGTRDYPRGIGLYEADLGAALRFELPRGWSAAAVYTAYLSPVDAFAAIHELGLEVAFSPTGDGITLGPRLLLARELRDAEASEDTYLELGVDIGLPTTGAMSWQVPVSVGLSVDGFYRDSTGTNEVLGFVGAGLEAATGFESLGLGRLPGVLYAGLSAVFVNPDARITRDTGNDVLWSVYAGVALDLQGL